MPACSKDKNDPRTLGKAGTETACPPSDGARGSASASDLAWLKEQWISNGDLASLTSKLVHTKLHERIGVPVYLYGCSQSAVWEHGSGAAVIGYAPKDDAQKRRPDRTTASSLLHTIGSPPKRAGKTARGFGGSSFKW